ncbi:prefoldin subunit alpha [Kocuria palustris]|nr:prefoldin subunit alpha [Kocuria palustris]
MSQQSIDLSQLPPQQLLEVRKQINEEVNHFASSLQALQAAQGKLRDCVDLVTKMSELKGLEVLIPMTLSLYLPGTIKDKDRFLVDIGTGYFVEKLADDAKKVYEKKVDKLNQDAQKLRDILVQKNEMLNSVNLMLRNRVEEFEKKQQGQENAKASVKT